MNRRELLRVAGAPVAVAAAASLGRDRVPSAIQGSGDPSCDIANQLALFGICRAVAANRETCHPCLAPGFLAEALDTAHRDFTPAAGMRNLDEAIDNLGVLARRRQSAPQVSKGGHPIGEIEAVTILHEPITDRGRHSPRVRVASACAD